MPRICGVTTRNVIHLYDLDTVSGMNSAGVLVLMVTGTADSNIETSAHMLKVGITMIVIDTDHSPIAGIKFAFAAANPSANAPR